MKHAMGVAVALALGLGLAASAQANNLNRQSATQSPYLQSGSTQQMEQQRVRPQRQAVRQLRQKRIASIHKTGKTRMAALKRHSRTQLARLQGKSSKTRLAMHRQNRQQNQAVGVGSSMPNNGPTIPQTQNAPGGTQNLNNTQPQNK